jgi:TolB protein
MMLRLAFKSTLAIVFAFFLIGNLLTRTAAAPPLDDEWQIVFQTRSRTTGFTSQHVMNLDGSEERLLGEEMSALHGHGCAPNGEHLVYQSDALWQAESGAAEPVRLDTSVSPARGTHLSTTNDGRFIAFAAASEHLTILDTVNNRSTDLTPLQPRNTSPAISPDGGRIAYSAYIDDYKTIYLIDTDGSNLNQLVAHGKANLAPSWSPDGSLLAYVSISDAGSDIYVLDVAHQITLRLTNDEATDHAPSWSPDGNHLVFISYRERRGAIYIMDWNGANPRRLTQDFRTNIAPCFLARRPAALVMSGQN